MSTLATPPKNTDAKAESNALHAIGVYILRPAGQQWTLTELFFLMRIIELALRARSALPEGEKSGERPVCGNAFLAELCICVDGVTSLAQGLQAVKEQIEAIEMLPESEITWRDFDEIVWRPYLPQNPTVPFEARTKSMLQWNKLRIAAEEQTTADLQVLCEISAKLLPPSPPNPPAP